MDYSPRYLALHCRPVEYGMTDRVFNQLCLSVTNFHEAPSWLSVNTLMKSTKRPIRDAELRLANHHQNRLSFARLKHVQKTNKPNSQSGVKFFDIVAIKFMLLLPLQNLSKISSFCALPCDKKIRDVFKFWAHNKSNNINTLLATPEDKVTVSRGIPYDTNCMYRIFFWVGITWHFILFQLIHETYLT